MIIIIIIIISQAHDIFKLLTLNIFNDFFGVTFNLIFKISQIYTDLRCLLAIKVLILVLVVVVVVLVLVVVVVVEAAAEAVAVVVFICLIKVILFYIFMK